MAKRFDVIWVALMVTGAVFTYAMKAGAGRTADHVVDLRAEIAHEREALTVLRAEWSVLDQPARLQGLIERYSTYLDLQPIDVRQLATIADIPEKPPAPDAGLDNVHTATIGMPMPRTVQTGVKP